MKRLFTCLSVFILICSTAIAQTSSPKLSPLTKKYLREVKKITGEEKRIHGYVYRTGADGKMYISAMIRVTANVNEAQINSLGVRIGTKAGNIWTAQIPVENAEAFTHVAGVDYIQFDEPALSNLDYARITTHADSVHAGINLPMPYNGEGVVVGVVDAGYDFGHPVYFDTTGVGYRVKKVWMQKNVTGPAPTGYAYGTEMTDSVALWNIGTDNGQTHATHVSGICAGSGFGSPTNGRKFRGFAYKADMVLVGITPDKSEWMNTGVSDMIDGINYVFTYAGSVGKPAVVNLSWGSPLGPRDGTGLFSAALDNLTGQGKIFVCSAGNNGGDSIHIQKTFTSTDTLVRTFLEISDSPTGKTTWVDMWGDTAKSFCVDISLYNNGSVISSTGFICLDDTVHEMQLLGINNDTCFVTITTSSSEFNNQPRIFLDFDNRSSLDSICISAKGTEGTINFWNSYVYNTTGYYGIFKSHNIPDAVNGDREMSISDIASSRSAITVGAYASKTQWTNIDGDTYNYNAYVTANNLVPFSSHGPTADGRVKPDITGPGLTVGSALSSYDTSFASTGTDYLFVDNIYHNPNNNRDYPFGQLSGTSMSSPAVAGITAMMLQACPTLNPDDVKNIFTQTAIIDSWTGAIPVGGDNLWGNGKVNAYGAVKAAQQITGIKTVSGTLGCNLFPNPNTGVFTIDFMGARSESLVIEIYDIAGHLISTESWDVNTGYNFKQFDLKKLGSGIYFTKVISKDKFSLMKMVVE